MIETTTTENVTPDVVLKNFWRNDERFADLFNAALFGGEQVINPKDLVEADTDVSSIVTFKKHAETIKKILDVVKKSAYGIDFVIWGLESQMKVHYAMPLRHMLGDSLGYLKEYTELAKKNKEEKVWDDSNEFLSGMKKGDRLHPMITLCVYYGEDPWDGPLSLTDMLEIPDELKPLVNDYKMNLVQITESEKYHFHTEDVHTLFEITRNIYQSNYKKIHHVYGNHEISSELGLTIGTITGSQKLIHHALERKGGALHVCKALEELEERCRHEGKFEGKIETTVKLYKEFNSTREAASAKLQKECQLSSEEAWKWVEKYWTE